MAKMFGRTEIKNTILAAFFMVFAVVFPQIFHMVGGVALGRMLLPMLFPILLGAFFLPPKFAATVGIFAPILSNFYTGGAMPPPFPNLPVLMIEFGLFALLVSALRTKLKNPFEILIISLFAGKMFTLVLAWLLATINPPFFAPVFGFVSVQLTGGLPGMAWQIVAIPFIVKAVTAATKRYNNGG